LAADKKPSELSFFRHPPISLRNLGRVDLSNRGTPIETVAILLGNTSAAVQKHYSPFVNPGSGRLMKPVAAIWK
jgi:hypothetical protein